MKFKSASLALLTVVAMSGCQDKPENPIKPDAPLSADTRFAAGQVAEGRADYTQAITQYEAAHQLNPAAPMPLQRLGVLYTQTKQFDKAVDAWSQYIVLTKNSAAGWCNMGLTEELAQHSAKAEAAYKQAIDRESTNESARVNYGLMLARQGRYDDATTQWQVVLTPAEVHYNLASVLQSQGNTAGAKTEYAKALELDPDMSDAKARLADLN